MTACIWMGIQAYWGGQAVKIILGAVIGPKFVEWGHALPEGARVDTASLVGFFVFLAVFAPMLLVAPERLQVPFRIAFVMIACTVVGMLVWALSASGGARALICTGPSVQGNILGWNTVYGLQSVVGVFGSGCLGQSDWTRYSKTPNAALFGQMVTAPIAICLTALCGLLVTSATAEIYGQVLWNPFQLPLAIQQNSLSAAARAGTFFAGLGFLASAIALCIATNSVAGGMDLAALCPKYINIRRGSYLITIVAVATCPWQFVTQAATFITVLSGWSVFLSPMTGIVISDYFLVRKQGLHTGDLYRGDSSSAYWYAFGFNWRAVAAWAMGFWPLVPGLIRQVQWVADGNGWDHLSSMSYFFGFFVALLLHWGLSWLFPTEKQTGDSPFFLDFHAAPRSSSSSYEDREAANIADEKAKSVSMVV
jgi:NCS1 family nucleobase:cation symporter-1